MNRSEFIKRMGAAALVPFVPNVVDNRPVVDLGHIIKREIPTVGGGDRKPLTNYIDSTIILNTTDNPLNYRTIVHAYDMTLETVMDEYIPYDNTIFEMTDFDMYRRTLTLSNLPDNYDKYELSVWKTDRIGQIEAVQPTKVFSRTYTLRFPPAVLIDLTNRVTL